MRSRCDSRFMYQVWMLVTILVGSAELTTRAAAQEINRAEYTEGLAWREENVEVSSGTLKDAKKNLDNVKALLVAKEAELIEAEAVFRAAEASGDSNAIADAWGNLGVVLIDLKFLRLDHDTAADQFDLAEDAWEKDSIWLEQFKNDYEAQSEPFAVRDYIARCKNRFCSPGSFLDDEKFTVFQPHVLEMVGVHHAYAQGLTGAGVRIGIEDDIVNFTLPEFAERVSYEGATLTYPVPFGDNYFSASQRCEREEISAPDCGIFPFFADFNELETLTVRWLISQSGWPEEGQDWFLHDDSLPEGDFRRWVKIPHGTVSTHGTIVASVAAGRDFGVAPGVIIIPIAKDFSPDGQTDQQTVESSLLSFIKSMPDQDRRQIDSTLAQEVDSDYAQYDIINRSYGIGVFDPASIAAVLDDPTQWWGDQFRQILPETWRAFMQTSRHPDERTIVVYAAGNSTQEFGGLGADLPYHESKVRGHQLSVMAVDHTGSHANYTNFCGALPADWNSDRWGRHFCLAAPGTVNAAGSGGKGWIVHEAEGTSFAAPVVSGALALLMEKFRGQLGNTEIVKRLVNTANNTGRYAQLEIYGAGLLDLEAALQPVGETVTGTQSVTSQAATTMFIVPPAFGNVGRKLANKGVEVATLDSMGAPFWTSPEQYLQSLWDPWGTISSFSGFLDTRNGFGLQLESYGFRNKLNLSASLPIFATDAKFSSGNAYFGFTPGTYAGPASFDGVRMLMGYDKVGFEKAPLSGFRWGFLGDTSSWQGGRSSGAFGDRAGSVTAWVGRSSQYALNKVWSLNASASIVMGNPLLDSGGMLDIEPHLLSTWDVGLERDLGRKGAWTRFSLSQPLRAEVGKGSFSFLSGLRDGEPTYEQRTFSLAPESRELELAWILEAPIARGRGVLEIAHSLNAGHEPGRERSRIGLAWWLTW